MATPIPWGDRLLGICPLLIALVWMAGVVHFRDIELEPIEWAVIAAAGFAVQIITRRVWRRKPLPPLPEGARAVPLAALIATFTAVFVFLVAGIGEYFVQQHFGSDYPWGIRTLWHAACGFAAAYCVFLQRLMQVIKP